MTIEPIKCDTEEQAIVGAVLVHSGLADEILAILQPEDFADAASQEIMTVIQGMRRKSIFPSLATFSAELTQSNEYLLSHAFDFSGSAPSTFELPPLIAKVEGFAQLRRLQTALGKQLIDLQDNRHDHKGVISRTETAIFDATEARRDVEIRSMAQVMGVTKKKIGDAYRLRKEGIKPEIISLGLHELDQYTVGLKPGQLIVIAARPGVGKSVIGLQAILANAAKGKPVGIVNLEMAAEDLTCRAIAADSRISLSRIIECDFDDSRKFEEEQSIRVMNSMDRIEDYPIWFVDCSTMKSGELRAKSRRLRSRYKIELLVIDYLQLLSSDEKERQRTLEVGEIARTAKSVAMDLKIPVIALAQLNRVEGEPAMHHLRESGEIEQAADVIILMHRYEETDDAVLNSLHPTKMNVAKNRNGKTGPIETMLEGRFCRFIASPRTSK